MELKYKVGCDPEFSILNDGERIHAYKCIEGLFRGNPNLEGNSLVTEGGEFGCDGCASTGELRPKPALEPEEVARNIRECFKPFMEKAPQLELSTLSLWAPVGGHIHLELPPGDHSQEKLASVHKRLMSYYLPILMGEHKTNLAIRQKSYGQITDYRCDGGSERRTMEIRCPSAEWLTSERTAKATLAYMTMVWHEVWDNPGNLDKRLLLKTAKQETALQELAVSEFDSVTRSLMRDIAKSVRKFSLYPKFRQEADFILRPDRVLAEKKRHNFTANSGWGFGTRKAGTPNKKRFLKAPSATDGRAEGMGISHNGDMNTGALCDELRARALDGFKFRNGYYFYGLKEGLDGHIVSSEYEVWSSPPVATAEEAARIREVASRMDSKAQTCCGAGAKLRLDFKTSKIAKEKRKVFAIGVPHKERANKAFRPTLELVWALEKGKLAPQATEILPKGQCASLPTGLSVEEPEGGAFETDHESQGRSFADQAVRELMQAQAAGDGTEDERRKAARLYDALARSCSFALPDGSVRAIVGVDTGRDAILTFNQAAAGNWSFRDLGQRCGWLPSGMRGFYRAMDGRVAGDAGARSYPLETDGELGGPLPAVRVDPANAGTRIPVLGEDGRWTGVFIRPEAGEDAETLLRHARGALSVSAEPDGEEEEEEEFKINLDTLCAE